MAFTTRRNGRRRLTFWALFLVCSAALPTGGVAAPASSSWSCPQARQREGMNGDPRASTKYMPAQSREPRGQLSQDLDLWTCLLPEAPLWGCGLTWSWYPMLFFTSEQSCCPWSSSSGWGHLGHMCSPSLRPCPSLSPGMDAQPVLVIVCSACLQPPSSSAPPLDCKVCFLIAAPTTHLVRRGAPPLPPSLPRQGWDWRRRLT